VLGGVPADDDRVVRRAVDEGVDEAGGQRQPSIEVVEDGGRAPNVVAGLRPGGGEPEAVTADVLVDADVLGRHRTGDETYVAHLLQELGSAPCAADLRVAACTRHPELVPAGVEPISLPARSQAARMARALPRLATRTAPVLHTQYVVPPGFRGAAVVTVHDLSFEHHPEWMARHDRVLFRTLVPRAVRRAAKVLTVSETTRRDLVERYGVPAERVVVTHNGVDPRFRPDGARVDRDAFLLFVGALHPRKGLLTALEAMARLPEVPPLVVVGPPKHGASAVEAAVSRLGLEGRVELTGHVGHDELAALYRSAEAFVFPSLFEGFGLPVVEAMASGTPVVTTTAGSLPEVAGDAAVLVPPGDPEALAAGIETALRDGPSLRTAGLANAARFRWADLAARTADVYREVLR